MPNFKKNTSPAMKRTPYKMKGNPMQRNFGISPAKHRDVWIVESEREAVKQHNESKATAEHFGPPHGPKPSEKTETPKDKKKKAGDE